MPKKKTLKYDPEIMEEMLKKPGLREQVAQLTQGELEWYKELLIKDGIYDRYCEERQNGI